MSIRKSSRRRGMTFPEMMIAVTIFTFIGLFVSYTTLLIARQVHRSLRLIPAEQRAYRVLDRARTELMAAQLGTVVVGNGGDSVTFTNPASGRTSRIWKQGNSCMWDPDTATQGDESDFGTIRDCQFEVGVKTVTVTISTTGRDKANEPIPISYSDVVVLRN